MASYPDPALGERIYPPLNDPAGNFWIDNNGVNTLKGVPDDPDNLPRLPDKFIVDAFSRTQKAHNDYQKLKLGLLQEEIDRIEALLAENPLLTEVVSPLSEGDAVQTRFNQIPVYTAGRFRGAGYRHNRLKNT